VECLHALRSVLTLVTDAALNIFGRTRLSAFSGLVSWLIAIAACSTFVTARLLTVSRAVSFPVAIVAFDDNTLMGCRLAFLLAELGGVSNAWAMISNA
jgi:hypothetical protein